MAIEDHEALWTTELSDYALIWPSLSDGVSNCSIVHKRSHAALIIEDDEEYREAIRRMLAAGVEVWDKLPRSGEKPCTPDEVVTH